MGKLAKLGLFAAAFFLLMAAASLLYGTLSRDAAGGGGQERSDTVSSGVAADGTGQVSGDAVQTAPDFSMEDGAGNPVSLSDWFGKPIALNFWASWCPPCRGEMPHFQEAYEAYGEEIAFVMVNLTDGSRETAETAEAFLAENGYTFPVLYDVRMEGAYAYGVSSIPATYFLDASGTVTAYQVGALDRETLFSQLEKLRG